MLWSKHYVLHNNIACVLHLISFILMHILVVCTFHYFLVKIPLEGSMLKTVPIYLNVTCIQGHEEENAGKIPFIVGT